METYPVHLGATRSQLTKQLTQVKFQALQTPRYPIRIYKEMLNDAGIMYPLQILKMPIVSSQPIYTHPNREIEEFVNAEISKIWAFNAEDILSALEFGFSLLEQRWEESDGYIRFKRWISIDPETVRLLADTDGSFLGAVVYSYSQATLPPWKCFLYSHRKRFENLYGESRLNAAYRYWLLDKELYNFHGVAAQHFAMPTIIFRFPSSGRITVKDEQGNEKTYDIAEYMRIAADSVYSRASVGIPSSEELKLEAFPEKPAIWDFNADHEWLDRKKALAIFCPEDIAISLSKGSYARAKEQTYWLVRTIEGIKQEIAQRYLLPYACARLISLNFPGEKYAGELRFSPEPAAARELIQAAMRALESPPPIDWEGILRSFGIPTQRRQGEQFTARSAREYLIGVFQQHIRYLKNKHGVSAYIPLSKDVRQFIEIQAEQLAQGEDRERVENAVKGAAEMEFYKAIRGQEQ